jgi:hypothetical protein
MIEEAEPSLEPVPEPHPGPRISQEVIVVLNRLRKLVFRVRSQSPNARFGDSLRRVNRLARLMTIMQRKPGRKAS